MPDDDYEDNNDDFMMTMMIFSLGLLDEKRGSLDAHLALHRLLPGQRGTHPPIFTSLLLYLYFIC